MSAFEKKLTCTIPRSRKLKSVGVKTKTKQNYENNMQFMST